MNSSSGYFTGTTSRLGGVGLDVIADEVAARHAQCLSRLGYLTGAPPSGGGR